MSSKLLLFISVFILSQMAYANKEPRVKECVEKFHLPETSKQTQRKCFKLLLENKNSLPQEAISLYQTIITDINNEKLAFLIPVLEEYASDNGIDIIDGDEVITNSVELQNLLEFLNSDNITEIQNSLVQISNQYLAIEKVHAKLKVLMSGSNTLVKREIFKFIVSLDYTKATSITEEEIEAKNEAIRNLNLLIKTLDITKHAANYARDINSTLTMKEISLKHLKEHNPKLYYSIIINNSEIDSSLIQFLKYEINNPLVLAKVVSLTTESPNKYIQLIPLIFQHAPQNIQAKYFSQISNNELDLDLFSTIIEAALNYQYQTYRKELFNLVKENQLSTEKKNIINLKLISTQGLSDELILVLADNTQDLNSRKELVCTISNGQNKESLKFLTKLYRSKSISEDIKSHSIKCLKFTMNKDFISLISSTHKNAKSYILKKESILALVNFIHPNKVAKLIQQLLIDSNNYKDQELFNILCAKPTILGNELIEEFIENSKRSTAKKLILQILKGSENIQHVARGLIKNNSKFAVDTIQLVSRHKHIQFLNTLIESKILDTLDKKTFRAIKRAVIKVGNTETLEKLGKLDINSANNLTQAEIDIIRAQIEQKASIQIEKYTKYLQQMKQIGSSNLNLEKIASLLKTTHDILTDKWNINDYIPGHTTDYKELLTQFVIIEKKLLNSEINTYSVEILYLLLANLKKLKLQVTSFNSDFIAADSIFFYSELVKKNTQTSVETVAAKLDELLSFKYNSNFLSLINYISLKNFIQIFSIKKFRVIIKEDTAQKISTKLRKDLVSAIQDITPYHPDLSHLSQFDIDTLLGGKQLFDPNDSTILSSNSQSNIPDRQIRIKNDLKVSPGIYMCPTASNCTLIINGKVEMDPFSLIVPHYQKGNQRIHTPDLKIIASSFGDLNIDLSANLTLPPKPAIASPGRTATYKSVFSRNERYCKKWVIICVSHGTRAIYKTVVDVPAASGEKGTAGIKGNDGGNLYLSYYVSGSKLNNITGKISFISNGSDAGEGGDGGLANSGPTRGLKGAGGKGGDSGNLVSEILLYDSLIENFFYMIGIGGKHGKDGEGIGEASVKLNGQNGVISAQN